MSQGEGSTTIEAAAVRAALKGQYRAGLAMHRDAVERCGDELWLDRGPANAFWQVAYHTLYFTHLYLCGQEADFRPWAEHQGEVQHEDAIAGADDPANPLPLLPEPYTRAQVLAYGRHLDGLVDGMVDALDLRRPDSGFWWYDMPKLEHQLLNVRHLGHHAAQLADRVRAAQGVGVRWVSGRANRAE